MKLFQDLLPTFWSNDYQPLAGGKIYVYTNSADETLCKLYSSSAGGDTALENPLPLNSAGRTDTPVYIDSDGAFVVVEDGNGVKVKEFAIEPENRIASGEAVYLKNSSELSQIKNLANGQYAEVREPAPCRLYRFAAGSAAAADGVLAISGVGGAWHLVAQSNWVYSSWWQGNDFAAFVNAANSYSYDMAVNSRLNNASDKNLNGKLKLMSGSQINTSGSATIYCPAGFETAPNAATSGNVRFELLGGSYDAWHLKGKRVVGHVDRLVLNEDYEINQNDVLYVHTLDGNANCSFTVYGRLHLFDTGNQNPGYKVIAESSVPNSVKVFLEGIVLAKIFQHSTDWSHIKASEIGGLEFYESDGEYTFTSVSDGYGIFSGYLKISNNSTATPIFNRIHTHAAIENNSAASCQAPKGIRLERLSGSGKFRFNGSRHSNEVFEGNFDSGSSDAAFEYCVFSKSIDLRSVKCERLAITNCPFAEDACILIDDDTEFYECDIRGNSSQDFAPVNLDIHNSHYQLMADAGKHEFSLRTDVLHYGSLKSAELWKQKFLIDTETGYADSRFISFYEDYKIEVDKINNAIAIVIAYPSGTNPRFKMIRFNQNELSWRAGF